uniref:Uncharacterized protein n=1 Tax=Roseihalotalea indica TaxID=2867963 RepID=A0AA49JFH4_9BACT|nr:hypothetical protein K4G66_21980 [Tunicatimonas sp. TK19036]
METIFLIELPYQDGELRVKLQGEVQQKRFGDSDELSLSFVINLPEADGRRTIEVNLLVDSQEPANLSVTGLFELPDLATCIIICGVKALTGPFLKCYNRNPKIYLKCLKNKGISIASSAIPCIIECLNDSQ